MIRISIDWENNTEHWWDAARAAYELLRTTSAQVVGTYELFELELDEFELNEHSADELKAWCAEIPGWDVGPPHARHPLSFEAV